MISKFKIGLIIAVLFIMTFLPGCVIEDSAEEEVPDDELLPITIVDDMGDSITITKWPERIVSLSPSITEILFEIGLGDKIVATDEASNYPEKAKDIKKVDSAYTGLHEDFALTDPDMVFINYNMDHDLEVKDRCELLGFTIIRFDPEFIEDIMDNIDTIGKVTNTASEAKTLRNAMESRVDEVEKKGNELEPSSKIKVLYVLYYDGETDPWVGGRDCIADDFISKSGGINIISGVEGYNVVSLETIVGENPDIIICSQDQQFPTETKNKILTDPALSTITAVKNSDVYEVDSDTIDRPGPRMVDGLEKVQEHIFTVMDKS
jgi:iron complex transport system substrate-binding protein